MLSDIRRAGRAGHVTSAGDGDEKDIALSRRE
jgi:hypothetical protein